MIIFGQATIAISTDDKTTTLNSNYKSVVTFRPVLYKN